MKNPIPTDFNPFLVALVILVSIIQLLIKAFAIWRASQLKQRNWFIALFILIPLNELGIIEIIYLFWFAKKRLTIKEIKTSFRRKNN